MSQRLASGQEPYHVFKQGSKQGSHLVSEHEQYHTVEQERRLCFEQQQQCLDMDTRLRFEQQQIGLTTEQKQWPASEQEQCFLNRNNVLRL